LGAVAFTGVVAGINPVSERIAATRNQTEELRRLKEELRLATKRAAEAYREDPTRVFPALAKKAQLADERVNALKRRIVDIEGASQRS
jgi:hypothetical protein